MKVKILLFGTAENCNQLEHYLRDEEITVVGGVQNENQVLDAINRFNPDIFMVAELSQVSLRACNQVYLLRPRCIPVFITDSREEGDIRSIMQAGVHYILSTDISPLELVSELKAIYSNESNRIMSLESTGKGSSKSKVLIIFGAKDGVGKTTLAVNLAVRLAQNKNKVVILDYNMQFGDVSVYLGGKTKETIIELLQEQANPNIDTIRQFLSLHVSGVHFLPSPFNPEDAGMVTAGQAERIISTLRIYYDYVIIDTNSVFNDITINCLDCSSMIFLMSGSDIPSLINTKKSLGVIRALTEEEKIKLVVGKAAKDSNKISDISRVLGIPVWNTIPYDRKSAIISANQGSPLVLSYGRSPISKAISKMVSEIDRPSVVGGNPLIRRFGKSK